MKTFVIVVAARSAIFLVGNVVTLCSAAEDVTAEDHDKALQGGIGNVLMLGWALVLLLWGRA